MKKMVIEFGKREDMLRGQTLKNGISVFSFPQLIWYVPTSITSLPFNLLEPLSP